MNSIQQWDVKWLLEINRSFNPGMDKIMWFISNPPSWIPFYLLLVAILIYKYKWDAFLMIVMVLPLILGTDQVSSGLVKPLVGRLRPSHEPGLQYMLHYVNDYRGGTFGFMSSHSCNSFGLAAYLTIITFRRMRWVPFIMFPWAATIAYSRMYLGVHYPTDVICGAMAGIGVAWLVSRLYYSQKKRLIIHTERTDTDRKVIFSYRRKMVTKAAA